MAKKPRSIEKWTLGRKIGWGGQSEVFEASSGEAAENVAIKVIKVSRPKKRARFIQEVRTHAKLSAASTPNILQVLDHNLEELARGGVRGYIVMPRAVSSLKDELPVLQGRYDLCLEVFEGILVGVQGAHDAGIIHRDIKPANVLFLDRTLRRPLVADFGICLLRETPEDDRLTDVDETVGAKFFMAPEQERGGKTEVTPAADVYALGKLAHNMLTGRLLFREEIAGAFTEREFSIDPRLKTVYERIIARTVVHDPKARIQSVGELLGIVRELRSDRSGPDGGGTGPVQPTPTPSSAEKRRQPQDESVRESYTRTTNLIEAGRTRAVALHFDEIRNRFRNEWEVLHSSIKDTPAKTKEAAVDLIHRQPEATATTLAIARTDSAELYGSWKRLLEAITRSSEGRAGYPAVFTVPHVQAGFLYMAAAVTAFQFESWNVLRLLLTEKFEWYFQSGRPMYSFGFSHTYFFHSEALGREAPKIHDLYRELLSEPQFLSILGVSSEELLDTYVQVHLVMSLRGAQLAEQGQDKSFWPDFGRFYEQRVVRLLDRIHADQTYAKGILASFGETSEGFLEKLTPRLTYLRRTFANSNYSWDSLMSWEPR